MTTRVEYPVLLSLDYHDEHEIVLHYDVPMTRNEARALEEWLSSLEYGHTPYVNLNTAISKLLGLLRTMNTTVNSRRARVIGGLKNPGDES